MSIERPAEYYDEAYLNSEEYSLPFAESPYKQMWGKVAELIPEGSKILDLGCGPGQFAEFLYSFGFNSYTGFDFSGVAVGACVSKELSGFKFEIADLNIFPVSNYDGLFVCLETFEHLKDYRLIENIGLGREIIFTVPDFNDEAHVRYFHSVNEVVDRYKHVIKFEHVQKFERWYICKGVTI